MARRSLALLAISTLGLTIGASGEPPTEFRLFKAGENETTKGTFTFDAKAAELVMAAAAQRAGVEYPIDLEHLSLDDEAPHFDPDARGWFRLEVRNGELWAVDVRWTPDGARRLNERTQRYVSPAFVTDSDGRVAEVVNVALVAMPATHGTPALIAAGRRNRMKTLKDRKNELAARLSIANGKLVKLADGEGDAPSGKFAAIKAAAADASTALAAIDEASKDVDAAMSAVDTALAAVQKFEAAVAAMSGGAPASPPDDPQTNAAQDGGDETQKMARKEAELISLRNELAKRDAEQRQREHAAQVEKLAREMDERRQLVGALVRLGRETPATAWADETATTPRGYLASMSIEELRARVKAFGGTPAPTFLSRVAAPTHHVEGGVGPAISESESVYLKARYDAKKREGMKLREWDETLARYTRHKAQQIRGADEARDHELGQKLSRPIESGMVTLGSRIGLITLSTPVQPIEEFGASSQIYLQNFRLEYNLALASIVGGWSESIGQVLSDGALKTTFPLNFRALRYTEKTANNPAAGSPMNADIPVTQRQFSEGQEINLRRLMKGDFAYALSWAQLAADLAAARIFLRDELTQALLEVAGDTAWGVSTAFPSGIDGQNYWSAAHAVNPFDGAKALRGSTTWSNYRSTATPFTVANLTAEKNLAIQVAAPDGRQLLTRFDGILYPSILDATVYNMLQVQDLVPNEAATSARASTTIRNPHFRSGLEMTPAQQLAGTDPTTADWYLYSREAIARGMKPWLLAEDPTEEVRLFDESSDHYKRTNNIRYESHVYLNAVLLYPHAIRKIKGS